MGWFKGNHNFWRSLRNKYYNCACDSKKSVEKLFVNLKKPQCFLLYLIKLKFEEKCKLDHYSVSRYSYNCLKQ